LFVTNASVASVAAYSVGVTNVAGGAASQGASLTLRPPPVAGSYESAIVSSAPIAYWRLGESEGSTTAFDYVGGNDGYYTNVTLGQPGYSSTDPNPAAAFDSAQLSVVGVPGLSQFNYAGSTPTFTLEAWANFTDFTGNQRLFSKGGPGFNGIGFGVFDNGTVLRFTTYGVQDFNLTLPTPLDPGTWYHIVGVADGGTFYYYTNGEPAGSIAFTGAGIVTAANPPFAIGRNGLGVSEAVNGVIDEAAVYNKALTAQEILTHYTAGVGQTSQESWSENFDSYANGSQAIGQGGWQGWGGDTTVSGLVTNSPSFSGPNSVRIYGTALTSGNYSDLVHQFSGYTNGQWVFSARQYIPTGTTGTNFFILLDNYADPDGPFNWAIQTSFNLTAGTLKEEQGTSSTRTILRDQWVELRYEIDLTANTVSAFYNGTNFSTHVWQTGENGLNEIRAIDLYSDVSGPVFYDDLSLKRALPPAVEVSIRRSGNAVTLSWPVSNGMYTIQSNPNLNTAGWAELSPQPPVTQVGSNYEAVIQISGPQSFYRLSR